MTFRSKFHQFLWFVAFAAAGWSASAPAATAADLRAIDFMGLQAGATIDQVGDHFALETRTIYSEPELPSLGVYYYRAVHESGAAGDGGITVTQLQADFDREGRLFRWNLVLAHPDRAAFEEMVDEFIAQNGPADIDQGQRARTVIYAIPWGNGIVGPEVRLRFVIDQVRSGVDQSVSGRMTVNFIDYRADEDNVRNAYYGAVDEERIRVGGPEYEPEPVR